MPWRETAPMKERMRFVTDWERDLYSMVELCERYGVSRKTGYKWVARYEREGPDGLDERSRAPHHCPHRIAADVAEDHVRLELRRLLDGVLGFLLAPGHGVVGRRGRQPRWNAFSRQPASSAMPSAPA